MRCDAGAACIHDHVWPRLKDPKPAAKGNGYRALAPCHPDTTHSLSVSYVMGRIVWNCFACTERLGKDIAQVLTRNMLIRAKVPAQCLPQNRVDAEDQLNTIRQILGDKDTGNRRILRIAMLLGGYDEVPSGAELRALAEDCCVSLRTAYELREAGLHP